MEDLQIKVLVYCPFPIHAPRHGNEARTRQLIDSLLQSNIRVVPFINVVDRVTHNAEISQEELCRNFTEWYLLDGENLFSANSPVRVIRKEKQLFSNWSLWFLKSLYRFGLRITKIRSAYVSIKTVRAFKYVVENLQPDAVIATYIWSTWLFRLLPRNTKRILDIHDVFSSEREIYAKDHNNGLSSFLTAKIETEMMRDSDLVVSIQRNETSLIKELQPNLSVMTVGYAIENKIVPTCSDRTVGVIGSANSSNVRGLSLFLTSVWPIVISKLPDAVLKVAGGQTKFLPFEHRSVQSLGVVDDLKEFYVNCRLVVNASIGGTGLKIKTLEALSYGRVVVCWPSGASGIDGDYQQVVVAKSSTEFANAIVQYLICDDSPTFLENQDEIVEKNYQSLIQYLYEK